MSLHSYMLDATVDNIRNSLQRHMPASHQRDFYLWGIDADNPLRDTFLYAMSVPQLINLSAFLLEDIVDPDQWKQLARYAGRLNTYFMYEVVSDDLAIGLSPLADGDATYPMRREILYAFNYAMGERLAGDPTPSGQVLEPLKQLTHSVSGFTQSMTREHHNLILGSYLEQHPDVSSADIEYALWPILVANIELCHDLTESMYRLNAGWMVRQGFIDRYQSVSELLQAPSALPLSELADIGTRSILVVPTLSYYVGVLTEVLNPHPQTYSIVSDGTLHEAVSTAALMVRLLNDVGLPLTLSSYERESLINGLWHHHQKYPEATSSITQLLINAAEDKAFQKLFNDEALLTRFQKDASAGEFNICLHNLAYTNSIEDGLTALDGNIAYFAHLYQQSQERLQTVLAQINAQMGSPIIGTLIWRFVQFYAALYAKPYKTSTGEYVA
jgi:hypothetical protein